MKESWKEDGLVWEYFGRKRDGFFVEVGANEPCGGSQTWFLEGKGWRGILVEPLPQLAARLRAERPRSRVFEAACAAPGHPEVVKFHESDCSAHSGLQRHLLDEHERYVALHRVRALTLDELLREAGDPRVDFLSVDVEGMQWEVLRGFDLPRHRPGLLAVEDHLFNWKTHRLVRRAGYRLVKRFGFNNWYVPPAQPFPFNTRVERLKLWRKVWPGTPVRSLKHWWERRRKGTG